LVVAVSSWVKNKYGWWGLKVLGDGGALDVLAWIEGAVELVCRAVGAAVEEVLQPRMSS
jgi:hypothetical protein